MTQLGVVNYLRGLGWNPESVSEAQSKLTGFDGIAVIKKNEILFSNASEWRCDEETALTITRNKFKNSFVVRVKEEEKCNSNDLCHICINCANIPLI